MSLCPECGCLYCDHTSEERGQTEAEMLRMLSGEEYEAFRDCDGDATKKLILAKKHAHDPVELVSPAQ
jgi:hypothetical protein